MIGIDPRPFSLRELTWMLEARQRSDWNHTAQLMAMMVNTAMKAKKTRLFQPREFHPFAKEMPKKRMTKEQTRNTLRSMAGARLKGE